MHNIDADGVDILFISARSGRGNGIWFGYAFFSSYLFRHLHEISFHLKTKYSEISLKQTFCETDNEQLPLHQECAKSAALQNIQTLKAQSKWSSVLKLIVQPKNFLQPIKL